jgi:hypothetical protein
MTGTTLPPRSLPTVSEPLLSQRTSLAQLFRQNHTVNNQKHAKMEYISESSLRTVFNVVTVVFMANVIMDAVFSSDSDEEEITQQQRTDRRFGPRGFAPRPMQFPRKDFNFNQFAEMLRTNSHLNPRHKDSRDFRSIFRVPPLFFEEIFQWFQERNRRKIADCTGRPGFILPLFLARACLFSDVAEFFCRRRLQAQGAQLFFYVSSWRVGACYLCSYWL